MPKPPELCRAIQSRRATLFLLVCLSASLFACDRTNPKQPSAPPRNLSIAAAASIRPAMDAIVEAFRALHPQASVYVTYGASGTFFAQLASRAPFDLFYSADTRYPSQLSEKGLALAGTQRTYAVGRLVLFVRNDAGLDLAKEGAAALRSPAIRHISIANPDLAPYGRAARQAFGPLGLGPDVEAKLVLGESVEQAAQYVQTGAAEAAFLPVSLASRPALAAIGSSWPVPDSAAPPIEHGMVILAWTANPDGAKEFDSFVAGLEGRRILAEHGLAVRE